MDSSNPQADSERIGNGHTSANAHPEVNTMDEKRGTDLEPVSGDDKTTEYPGKFKFTLIMIRYAQSTTAEALLMRGGSMYQLTSFSLCLGVFCQALVYSPPFCFNLDLRRP